jgi:hypothetical protein
MDAGLLLEVMVVPRQNVSTVILLPLQFRYRVVAYRIPPLYFDNTRASVRIKSTEVRIVPPDIGKMRVDFDLKPARIGCVQIANKP